MPSSSIVPTSQPVASRRLRLPLKDSFEIVRDPLRILMVLLTLFTIGRLHQQYPFLAKFRPALLLTLLVGAYAFMNKKSLSTARPLATWPARLMLAMLLFACIGAPFGISLGASATFILGVYAKVILFAFLLIFSIRGSQDLYTLVWGYVASSALVAWLALFVFGLQKYDGYSRLGRMGTYDANDIG